MTTKLYVGNLPWNVTKEQLSELFSQYGQVDDSFIPTDRETGRPRGFGFVTLESNAAKNAAASLNNTDFQGRTIRVNEAAPPGESRSRGGYNGGGGGGYGAPRGGRDNYGVCGRVQAVVVAMAAAVVAMAAAVVSNALYAVTADDVIMAHSCSHGCKGL
ncbi:hypothetical protein QJQ45_012779 [Haematococcus lacustris]|nr:hypothetical protein QJQ45_012779 [Haematococcus lacustris]